MVIDARFSDAISYFLEKPSDCQIVPYNLKVFATMPMNEIAPATDSTQRRLFPMEGVMNLIDQGIAVMGDYCLSNG